MESWTHNGIESCGEKHWLVGKYEDRKVGGCIILGCSKNVWDDYHKASELFDSKKDYDVIAINDIGIQFKAEHVEHLVSVHHQMPGPMRDLRVVRITNSPYTHSKKAYKGVDFVWNDLVKSGGTSAMLAMKIAVLMGYKKIVLCGCGLDKTGHYYDPEFPEDNENGWFDEACRAPWKTFYKDNKEARRRVRFMSGELKKIYGEPSHDWVYNKSFEVANGI